MSTTTYILVKKAPLAEPALEVAAVAVINKRNVMQHTNISKQLGVAASSLLAASQAQAADSETLYSSWNVDVGYLYYEEPEYIAVDTYMAMINGNLSDKDTIKLGVVFDTLSGATPSGALPDSEIVSVSGVSGGGVSGAGGSGGKVAFDDTRLAVDVQWGHELKRLLRSKVSAYMSVEGDYTAVGGSLGIEQDSEDKAYTLSAAIGLATDKVSKSDESTPEPLEELANAANYGAGHKNAVDLMIGATRVINRRTQGMLNLSYSLSLGYHTDPYKIISVADSADTELTQVTEHRPDTRERFIIFSKIMHELPSSGHHLGLSYRFHADSWNVNSHTFEGSYNIKLKSQNTIEPFVRLYHQQAADFYTRTILIESGTVFNDVSLPTHASADVRLSEMQSTTLGTKYTYKTSAKGSIDARIGYYHRNYNDAIINDDGAYFVQVDFSKAFN